MSSRLGSSVDRDVGSSDSSSKAGNDGSEGMSRPSTSSMRRQTLDGVSSIAAMMELECPSSSVSRGCIVNCLFATYLPSVPRPANSQPTLVFRTRSSVAETRPDATRLEHHVIASTQMPRCR